MTANTLICADVHVRRGGKTVLDGVSAAFRGGEVCAVVGPNGAGKSTLLACLAGLLKPAGGDLLLDGAPLDAMPARRRARRIALLPQSHEVAWAVQARTLVGLGRTPHVGAFGLTAQDRAAVDRALAAAGAQALADRLVTTLSGGELARVLIARALAGEPQWLLADEPMAGLDPGHQLDAARLFGELAAKGAGVVVTLHDLSAALRMADRVIVLAKGRVLADGEPQTALSPATLAQAYGVKTRLTQGEGGPLIEIVGRV